MTHLRGYQDRIVDRELDELVSALPAVNIVGARGVGKTVTASRRASTRFELDRPGQLDVLRADPTRILQAEGPTLVDEWQLHPPLWDLVRRSIDDDPRPGRFLLTGSASPKTPPTHTGAGRIVTVRMRPMTLLERGLSSPAVSLAELISGRRPAIRGGCDIVLEDYVDEILAGGFPGMRRSFGPAQRAMLDAYLDLIFDYEFEAAGRAIRSPGSLRRWLTAYAASTATTASFETIREAATAGNGRIVAKSTAIPYRETLERLWLLDPLPPWLPTRNALTRLSQAPRHHLVDPALAARMLGAGKGALLSGDPMGPPIPRDGTLLGALFESLVTLNVRVYAQASEAKVHHLRTWGGDHEVDLIVVRDDQRVVAIEVKLSATVEESDFRHLRWLAGEIGPDLLDSIVITTGTEAYRRADGIAVVPAALLGP
jgi:predicted AAA+ superfamily ATPase